MGEGSDSAPGGEPEGGRRDARNGGHKEARDGQPFTVRPYNRYFAVWDRDDTLVVVAVYRRGAREVARRLNLWHPRRRQRRQKEAGGR